MPDPKGKGLLVAIGLGKPKKPPMPMMDEEEPEAEEDTFAEHAGMAFDAIQENDREGFISAMRACYESM